MNEKTILLVEDNPIDEKLTVRALEKNKIANKVIVARDGAEALDFLFCRGKFAACDPLNLPEMVLLDLKLPKVDGLDVLRKIRSNERTKLLPVVILTSSLEDKDVIESYQLGANSYIRKQIDFDQFAEAVRHLGLYWLVLNVGPSKKSDPIITKSPSED
ncbi:MAG: response regulator [Bdellovibrio sp.]|nr:response regulator [Bdellovibrio sp.]